MRIETLTDFLTAGDTDYAIFDLGRLVRQIPNEQFAAIETGLMPYPGPLQQHAWLGILFWGRAAQTAPYIWFAKFPLDERGLLNHAARQHFLQIIVEALGSDITTNPDQDQQKRLSQNPYLFTPDDTKRAAFHARVSLYLQQPASIYFEDVQAFILGQREPATWQQLGLQGLHDVAARLNTTPPLAHAIARQLEHWPQDFSHKVLLSLEHHELPDSLSHSIRQRIASDTLTPPRLVTHLRALAGAGNTDAVTTTLSDVLQRYQSAPELDDILIIIAARLWPTLEDNNLRQLFIEQLATRTELFPHLLADLIAIPLLRPYLLALLREPDTHSHAVKTAIQAMKQQVSSHV